MAKALLQLTTEEFRRKYPGTPALGPKESFTVQPMQDSVIGDVRPSLWMLFGTVCVVLLIACTNVAGLLVVRATRRKHEIAIRAAIGGGRGAIIRQLLTESLLLSGAGGVLGLLIGILGMRGLLLVNPRMIPRIGESGSRVTVDVHVLLFTLAVSLTTAVLFGLIPAVHASGADLTFALKQSGGRSGITLRQNKARSVLVVTEVALAFVLLVGASLLIRSAIALRAVHLGFEADNILTMRMSLDDAKFRQTPEVGRVVQIGAPTNRHHSGCACSGRQLVAAPRNVGRPLNGSSHGFAHWDYVSPGNFDVFKIPLVRGRMFVREDDGAAARVAIINQRMAQLM